MKRNSRNNVDTSSQQSLWQSIINLDVALSKPIFQLSLPTWLEFLLSFPGNLLGPPFLQIVAPLCMLALVPETEDDNLDGTISHGRLQMAALGSMVCLLLIPWILVLRGHSWIFTRILFSHASFAVAPLLGMSIAQDCSTFTSNKDRKITASLCFHFLMLYNASCIPVLFLKHGTRRPRPCCAYPEYISQKQFPVIPQILSRTGAESSFPSGDAMSAMCLALALAHVPHEEKSVQYYPRVGCVLVLLAALGRLYFLAHHFLDTLVGMAIPVCLHILCTATNSDFQLLPSIGKTQWQHSLGAFLALVIASRFRRSNQK